MSIRIRVRTRQREWTDIIAAMLLCLLAAGSAALPAPPDTSPLQRDRDAFRAAYAAAQAGQDWRALAGGLDAYPLYPYLEAAALLHDIRAARTPEVAAYLQRDAGLIPAGDVRKAELRNLALQQDWAAFAQFYRPGLGDEFTCAALQASIAQGQPLDFERDLTTLWQQVSLPATCVPVFTAAFAQGLLTPARVWARIDRAAAAGNADAITQAAAWLPTADAADAVRLDAAVRTPAALLQQAASVGDTARTRMTVALALTRFARRDSAQALAFWQSLSPRFAFDAGQRRQLRATLALYNAVDGGPDAVSRLVALPPADQTDATRAWRVRAAVATGDWSAAAAALAALTPEQSQRDEWRYWQARVADQLGHRDVARADYTALAQQATFYGFLAADKAGLPYSICPATVPPDPAADRQIMAMPGFARAFEFHALDMLKPARREWDRAFAALPASQQTQAVALAARMGWVDRAVFALASSGDLDYYALRFPLADEGRVLTAARAADIDPAWAFAIIRAETAWQPDAQSTADARGLMQLQPATASRVARTSGLPYAGGDSLYDPAINIPLGTQYLADLAMRFDGSPWLASAAYNAGPANAQRWVDARANLEPDAFILTIPFNETRDYVTRVLSFATIYGWRLHGKPMPISQRLPAIGAPYDPPVNPRRKDVVCRAPTPVPVPANPGSAPATPASTGSVSP